MNSYAYKGNDIRRSPSICAQMKFSWVCLKQKWVICNTNKMWIFNFNISATLTRLIWKISFTSRETVYRDGVTTLLLRSVNISRSSGSSTIANGRFRRTTQRAIFHLVLLWCVWLLTGVRREAGLPAQSQVVVKWSHSRTWCLRLLVLVIMPSTSDTNWRSPRIKMKNIRTC